MRGILVSFAVLLSTPVCGTEPIRAAKKVVCHIRGLEGNPAGSVEEGTIKVLWKHSAGTVEGEEVGYGAGGDSEVPDTAQTIYSGVWVSIKPIKAYKEAVTARITLEMTRLDDTDQETYRISSGKVVKAVGTFSCDKPIKLVGQEKINGQQFWIEVTFDEIEEDAPLARAILLKPVALPKKKVSPQP